MWWSTGVRDECMCAEYQSELVGPGRFTPRQSPGFRGSAVLTVHVGLRWALWDRGAPAEARARVSLTAVSHWPITPGVCRLGRGAQSSRGACFNSAMLLVVSCPQVDHVQHFISIVVFCSQTSRIPIDTSILTPNFTDASCDPILQGASCNPSVSPPSPFVCRSILVFVDHC